MIQGFLSGCFRPTPDIRPIKKTPQKAGVIDERNDAHGSAAVTIHLSTGFVGPATVTDARGYCG